MMIFLLFVSSVAIGGCAYCLYSLIRFKEFMSDKIHELEYTTVSHARLNSRLDDYVTRKDLEKRITHIVDDIEDCQFIVNCLDDSVRVYRDENKKLSSSLDSVKYDVKALRSVDKVNNQCFLKIFNSLDELHRKVEKNG